MYRKVPLQLVMSRFFISVAILALFAKPSFVSSNASFASLLEALYASQEQNTLDYADRAPENLTSINYNGLYDPYLASPSSLSTQSLDSLKYQFQKVARTGRLFTPGNGASAEFAAEWKVPLVEINFQKLIFGARRNDEESHARTFGVHSSDENEEGESTSEVVVFNQSALLIVGIVVIAALLIFPTFSQSLGINRTQREEDHNGVDEVDILERIDEYLNMFGVDGQSCMNLMVCSATEKLKKTSENGTENPFEQVVQGFMEIDHVKEFLSKSKFSEAIEIARNEEDCDAEYSKCPFSIGMMESMFGGWLQKTFASQDSN